MSPTETKKPAASANPQELLKQLSRTLVVGVIYFLLARASLALASIHPSASPIWPPTGFALAAVLLLGYRVWPGIFVAAAAVNAITAGSIPTSIAIGAGNTLESVMGAYLINRWSSGSSTFETPLGVARFAAIMLAPSTMISATIGVLSLTIAGYASWAGLPSIWLTWWMGDLAGALVLTPAIVLWAMSPPHSLTRGELARSAWVFGSAVVVGIVAFSPLLRQTEMRGPLAFLAMLPLMWAALRRGQRDTATAALILSAFAVGGTLANGGPFARSDLNDSFLLVLAFMISTSVPSLALSADVAMRGRIESGGRFLHELSDRLRVLDDPDAIMRTASAALGRYLGVSRTGYSEVDNQGFGVARAQWHVDYLGDVTMRVPAAALPAAAVEQLLRGETRVVSDVEVDPQSASALAIYRSLDTRAVITVPLVKEGRLRAAVHVAQDRPRHWASAEIELCEEVAERTWAAVERARAEAAANREIGERKRNEERLEQIVQALDKSTAQLVEHARVLDLANVLVRDIDDRITLWNEGVRRLYGWTKDEAIGRISHELMRTQFPQPQKEIREHLLAHGSWDGELVHLTKEGHRVVSQSHWELHRGADGIPAAILETNTDITERKRHEDHIQLVMRELSHRSKNLLAIVLSIARQVGRQCEDYQAFEAAFSARIAALADTHDLLVSQGWRGAGLLELARAHLAPFGATEGGRVMLEGPDVVLQPKAVEQVGLAIHELATNAARFGALSAPAGLVTVSWTLDGPGNGKRDLMIAWQESGGPPVEAPERKGFGHVVLTRVVPGSLQGRATLAFDRDGICWKLVVPADGAVGFDDEWSAAPVSEVKSPRSMATAVAPSA
jgi:PAS domain S-box-containing protein